MASIYKITNKINNKIYIGQTRQKVARRWMEHKRDSKKQRYNSLIHKAMSKYGIENFSLTVVEEVEVEELNDREQFWIQYYNSLKPYGYNLTSGGCQNYRLSEDSIERYRKASTGRLHSEETKRKISQAHKGKTMPERTRLKLREVNKLRTGENNGFYGKRHSEATKEKLREYNLGRKHPLESRRKMSESRRGEKHHNYGKRGKDSTRSTIIYKYDDDWNIVERFDTLGETLQHLGIKGHSNLYKAIKNRRKYKDYYWSRNNVETIESTP